jgi:hypothetical protein
VLGVEVREVGMSEKITSEVISRFCRKPRRVDD